METVELRGLKYDPVLQDENSGYSIVLSSVLKSKVSQILTMTRARHFPLRMLKPCIDLFLSD